MRFRVMDNKTGKEADTWNIALHEEWAQGLVYCYMEGFAITEDGYLVLMDECGHVVYCDTDRFKVVFEDDRTKGEWIPQDEFEAYNKCSICGIVIDNDFPIWRNFCPNCGYPMKKEGDENGIDS